MASKGYERKPGRRQPRQSVAIFSEGEVTEVEYLNYLLKQLAIPKELISIMPSEHSDPKGLVDDAVAAKKRNEHDSRKKGVALVESWWVLADTELTRPGLHEAAQKAKDNGVWLGLCDPSIEFWLLLHFCYTTKGYDSVKTLIHELKAHLPSYHASNKHPDMKTLFPLLPFAMENAAKLRRSHTVNGNGSPRTDVDLLISEINCQAGRDRSLFDCLRPNRKDLSMYNCQFG